MLLNYKYNQPYYYFYYNYLEVLEEVSLLLLEQRPERLMLQESVPERADVDAHNLFDKMNCFKMDLEYSSK